MTPRDALRVLAERLPPGAAIPVLREDLLELLGDTPGSPAAIDLTVDQVAAALNRKPSTVRGWCKSGALAGYRLNGREWRVTSAALRAYQQQEAPPVSLGAWKDKPSTGKAS